MFITAALKSSYDNDNIYVLLWSAYFDSLLPLKIFFPAFLWEIVLDYILYILNILQWYSEPYLNSMKNLDCFPLAGNEAS